MRNISHKDVSLLLELLSRQELAKYPIFTAKEYDAIIRKQPNLVKHINNKYIRIIILMTSFTPVGRVQSLQ